ncbi:MAG: uracil-DNA glycosylase [Candidatus Cloacimonadales bacterium]|nr:uracil-DNA glycosylase [Candidatus Cloacimonadales bacterium]
MNEKVLKQYLEYLQLSGIQDIFYTPKAIRTVKIAKNSEPQTNQQIAENYNPQTSQPVKENFDPQTRLQELEAKYKECRNCELWRGRTKFCYGNGNARAKLMLIGEGPGADEDRTGQVFVGKAGQLLTKMLQAIHLEREEVYIANIVKCRPPGNRNPLPEEKNACYPYLEEQIDIIKPKLILLLGKVAASTILEFDGTMADYRSQTYTFKGIKTYVSFHPSALLRNPNWKKPTWIDLQNVQKDYENL